MAAIARKRKKREQADALNVALLGARGGKKDIDEVFRELDR